MEETNWSEDWDSFLYYDGTKTTTEIQSLVDAVNEEVGRQMLTLDDGVAMVRALEETTLQRRVIWKTTSA